MFVYYTNEINSYPIISSLNDTTFAAKLNS